ncbi:hypothetical protein QJQ45_017035, partial [Haematococcus lacustris]
MAALRLNWRAPRIRQGRGKCAALRPQVLDGAAAQACLADIDCILFDCDGVLWKGSQQVHNAAPALQVLRKQGKQLLFCTNNASKSRAGYVAKFSSLGLDVQTHEIVSASYAAAAYLASQPGFISQPSPQGMDDAAAASTQKRVLLLGNSGVEQELDQAGIAWVGGEAWAPPSSLSLTPDAMNGVVLDASIGAVLVGWDPGFSYSKLGLAATMSSLLPLDAKVEEAEAGAEAELARRGSLQRMMPGTGAIAAAVALASSRQPVVVGKGGPWLLPHLLQRYGLVPERTAIVVRGALCNRCLGVMLARRHRPQYSCRGTARPGPAHHCQQHRRTGWPILLIRHLVACKTKATAAVAAAPAAAAAAAAAAAERSSREKQQRLSLPPRLPSSRGGMQQWIRCGAPGYCQRYGHSEAYRPRADIAPQGARACRHHMSLSMRCPPSAHDVMAAAVGEAVLAAAAMVAAVAAAQQEWAVITRMQINNINWQPATRVVATSTGAAAAAGGVAATMA